MTQRESIRPFGGGLRVSPGALWWAVVAVSLAGIGLTTYLSILYFQHQTPFCGPLQGCERVTTSQYARFLGVPVALLGLGGYSLLFMGALAMLAGYGGRPLAVGLALSALFGVAFSAYLTTVSVVVIRATCAYCLTSFGLITLNLLLITGAVLATGRDRPGRDTT